MGECIYPCHPKPSLTKPPFPIFFSCLFSRQSSACSTFFGFSAAFLLLYPVFYSVPGVDPHSLWIGHEEDLDDWLRQDGFGRNPINAGAALHGGLICRGFCIDMYIRLMLASAFTWTSSMSFGSPPRRCHWATYLSYLRERLRGRT